MAINKYFKSQYPGISSEQNLLQNMVTETIQINGIDVYYVPRTHNNLDNLLHEDPLSSFDSYYVIEGYVSEYSGFGEDGDMLSKFGFRLNDEITIEFSLSRFKEVTNTNMAKEGDLIYFPLVKSLFEIKHVSDEDGFYQLNTNPTIKITAEKFQYSSEDFSTGISDIDSIADITIPFADNDILEAEGNNITDTTETNIFGEY